MPEPQFLYLTTIGRRSREPREIEIWFTQRAGRHYVIAEYETSNWVKNVRANPEIRYRVDGQAFRGQARILNPASDAQLWEEIRELSRQKYGWGEGLVVELKPE